jgi:DNA gyrase subunit A
VFTRQQVNRNCLSPRRKGKGIRFHEDQIRPTGRVTRGVKAMKLREDDEVVTIDNINRGKEVFMITENGIGKRTALEEYPVQNRHGYGVIATKVNSRTGKVVRASIILPGDEIIVTTTQGYVIRLSAEDVSVQSRATMGVIVIRLDEDDLCNGILYYPL